MSFENSEENVVVNIAEVCLPQQQEDGLKRKCPWIPWIPTIMRPSFGGHTGRLNIANVEKTPLASPAVSVARDSPDTYSCHSSHDDEYKREFYRRRAELCRLRDHGAARVGAHDLSPESVSSGDFTASLDGEDHHEDLYDEEDSQLSEPKEKCEWRTEILRRMSNDYVAWAEVADTSGVADTSYESDETTVGPADVEVDAVVDDLFDVETPVWGPWLDSKNNGL